MLDAFVIGGGPAGLAAAIALRGEGLSVMVADAISPPIDKPCGEGLMPDALAALARLGVKIPHHRSHRFRGIRFVNGPHSVDSSFAGDRGIGLRRTLLHQLLIDRAQEVGIEMLWGAHVAGISENCVHLKGGKVRTRWIIGADGIASRVRRWADLEKTWRESRRFGFRRHYRIKPWSEFVEIHWGDRHQVYVTPIAPDEVCVALISRDPHLRLTEALENFPALRRDLDNAPIFSAERGSVVVSRRLRRVYNGNVALIGDASGSVDAITGQGLYLAFRQSIALARAIAENDLRAYQAMHRRIWRKPALMTDLMLWLGESPRLRSGATRVLAAHPAVFEKMLAMHVGKPHRGFLEEEPCNSSIS